MFSSSEDIDGIPYLFLHLFSADGFMVKSKAAGLCSRNSAVTVGRKCQWTKATRIQFLKSRLENKNKV